MSPSPLSPETLVQRWSPSVTRWCARLGGPRVDPEEAAQDVLITAITRLPSLRDPGAVEAWLFGITRRVLAAHRRRAWWRRWVPGVSLERADPAPSPELSAHSRRRAQQVQIWMEALPVAQREVLVLCAVERRSATEVAAMLDVPVGTVKSRLRLARARLEASAKEGA